jgi:hypothetical protein
MTKEPITKKSAQPILKAKLEINQSREETLSRLSAVESILSPFWSWRCSVRTGDSKNIFILLVVLWGLLSMGPRQLLASEGQSSIYEQPAMVTTIGWRWGGSSTPQKTPYAGHPATSLFESDKTWGWKEWSIIVGSIAAVAGVVVVVASKSGGGGGSGGSHY